MTSSGTAQGPWDVWVLEFRLRASVLDSNHWETPQACFFRAVSRGSSSSLSAASPSKGAFIDPFSKAYETRIHGPIFLKQAPNI